MTDGLEEIRQELARLSERVAALEAGAGRGNKPVAPIAASPSEELSEDVLLVISAAVAAFLGKKPRIRQIRLVGATAWAQQGRVTIQASHALSVRQGRSPQ